MIPHLLHDKEYFWSFDEKYHIFSYYFLFFSSFNCKYLKLIKIYIYIGFCIFDKLFICTQSNVEEKHPFAVHVFQSCILYSIGQSTSQTLLYFIFSPSSHFPPASEPNFILYHSQLLSCSAKFNPFTIIHHIQKNPQKFCITKKERKKKKKGLSIPQGFRISWWDWLGEKLFVKCHGQRRNPGNDLHTNSAIIWRALWCNPSKAGAFVHTINFYGPSS